MTRTAVHLVRHGEVHNPDGVLYGRLPGFHLSERGRAQAKRLAGHFVGADLAAVLSSPLERARETAAPIAAGHGLEVVVDERLVEAANAFEGKRFAVGDGVLREPRTWSTLRNPFKPSWGEPYLEVAHRMLAAAHRARALAEGHEAVCVSHQLPVWTLRRYLAGQRLWHDPRRRECSLASVTTLCFHDEQVVAVSYAEPAGATDPTVTGA